MRLGPASPKSVLGVPAGLRAEVSPSVTVEQFTGGSVPSPLVNDNALGDLQRGMEPTLTPKLAPYLVTTDCAALAGFVERGIGGSRAYQEVDSDGKFVHLEMRVADSLVMMADAPKGRPPFPAMLHLYVSDVAAAHRRAIAAGATNVREPTEASDGRRGGVRDPWGNEWWFTQRR